MLPNEYSKSDYRCNKVDDFDQRRQAMKVWRLKRRRAVQGTITVSDDLADHLRQFIRWKWRLDQVVHADAPLFVGNRGPLTARGLQQIWKGAIRRVGLPDDLSIYSDRHTMAVYLLHRLGNLRMGQKQLGHSSPITTANMYADVPFEEMLARLNRLYEAGED